MLNRLEQERMRNARMRENLKRRLAKYNRPMSGQPESDINQLPLHERPGNIGDIDKVIWPFFFTFTSPTLAAQTGANAFISVTQEAAFIWMKVSKVVFIKEEIAAPIYRYTAIDSNNPNELLRCAHDLKISIRDAQSSRVFFATAQEIDHFGTGSEPTVLPTPQLFLPNSTIECVYQNDHASRVYIPFITLFGYRVRIDKANEILSTITG